MAGLDEFNEGRLLGGLKKKLLVVGRAFAIHLDRSTGYIRTLEIYVVVWSLGAPGTPVHLSETGESLGPSHRPLEMCRVGIF